jgi:hypothetical protein
MGVFKDIHNLKKQARDMQANMPSAREQMANAPTRLRRRTRPPAPRPASPTAPR